MGKQKNIRGNYLKVSVDALKMCQSFMGDFLDMYNTKQVGKRKDDAATIAMCIKDCCKAFTDNFNRYTNTTNNQ